MDCEQMTIDMLMEESTEQYDADKLREMAIEWARTALEIMDSWKEKYK